MNNNQYWIALMILAAIASMVVFNLPARADSLVDRTCKEVLSRNAKPDKWEGVFTVDISKLPLKGKGKPNGKLKNKK